MHKQVLASLKTFDSYASGVRSASYYFLEMQDFPPISKDAKVCVSMFLEKPELDLDYRDEASFNEDVAKVVEWLNNFEPRLTDNAVRIAKRFEEEDFTLTLSLWK